ncbi:hypothetical protein RNAN_2049 [Rheinheimera nanhaiensis E407-8]|uniref:Uncharacterized protein n=1 Tax=Rheinheimera nanhaiensis E407-8 TaxID=562729 RepID=I1DYD1_9GAMM|nr:hypothetical protein RNAN_2049 [Rheinheimera nanhaiensis E407-8]
MTVTCLLQQDRAILPAQVHLYEQKLRWLSFFTQNPALTIAKQP